MHIPKAVNLIILTIALITSSTYGAANQGLEMLLEASHVIEKNSNCLSIKSTKKKQKKLPYEPTWRSIKESDNFEGVRVQVTSDPVFSGTLKFYKEHLVHEGQEPPKEEICNHILRTYDKEELKNFIDTIHQALKKFGSNSLRQKRSNLLRALVSADVSISSVGTSKSSGVGKITFLTGLSKVLADFSYLEKGVSDLF